MVKTVVVLLMLLTVPAWSVTRPPDLEPNDVPFAYEPNLCTSPVMDWAYAQPNLASIYSIGSHNKWGMDTEITVNDANIIIQKLDKVKDPDGGWNQYFQIMFAYSVDGVHYIEITVTDKIGRSDSRTLLVLVVSNDPPFVFPGSLRPPVADSRINEAKRFWQYARKRGYRVTMPTNVWN